MTSQAPQRLGLVFPEQPAGNSSQQHSSDAYACPAAATGISGQKQATNRYQNTSSYPRSGDGGGGGGGGIQAVSRTLSPVAGVRLWSGQRPLERTYGAGLLAWRARQCPAGEPEPVRPALAHAALCNS